MERISDERISGEEMRMLIGDEESDNEMDNEMDHIRINGLSTLMGYSDDVHSTTSDTNTVDRDEAKEFGAKLDAAMSRFWERENEITRVRSARPFRGLPIHQIAALSLAVTDGRARLRLHAQLPTDRSHQASHAPGRL